MTRPAVGVDAKHVTVERHEPDGVLYTNLREGYAVLSPLVCDGAKGVGATDVPEWQQALGVLVLVHESFHLRHWRWRRSEGKVECQAMVYFREAAVRLGATEAEAYALYAYAIALHLYKVSVFPEYRDRGCRFALWAPPASQRRRPRATALLTLARRRRYRPGIRGKA